MRLTETGSLIPAKTLLLAISSGQYLRASGLTLDRFDRTVTLPVSSTRAEPETLELTGIEFRVLNALMACAPKPLSREELLLLVWKVDWPIDSNRVEVAISQLRRRIGAHFVISVRGRGYRLGTGCKCRGCANGQPCAPGALGQGLGI